MTFDEHSSQWIDPLVDWAQANPAQAAHLARIATSRPTKANVQKLSIWVRLTCAPLLFAKSKHGNGLHALHLHADAVANKRFRKEFRFAFGEITAAESFRTNFQKVSAASVLFGLIRQSLRQFLPR
jgi:hypothetical protein